MTRLNNWLFVLGNLADFKYDNWVTQIARNPVLLDYSLVPLPSLLANNAKRSNLHKAIAGYMATNGTTTTKLSTCTLPTSSASFKLNPLWLATNSLLECFKRLSRN